MSELEVTSNGSMIIPVQQPEELTAWLGDYGDLTGQLALLPERVDFDKKTGQWVSESFTSSKFVGQLVAATSLWAKWTDELGRPEFIEIGKKPVGVEGVSMGLRVLMADRDGFLFYWDAFGICLKAALSGLKSAQRNSGYIAYIDKKEVNTRFGRLYAPKLEQIDL